MRTWAWVPAGRDRTQSNGKVELRLQAVLRECLYLHPDAIEVELQHTLDTCTEYHNHDRPYLGTKRLTHVSHLASLSKAL